MHTQQYFTASLVNTNHNMRNMIVLFVMPPPTPPPTDPPPPTTHIHTARRARALRCMIACCIALLHANMRLGHVLF